MDLIEFLKLVNELSKEYSNKFMVLTGYEDTPMCYVLLDYSPFAAFYYQNNGKLIKHDVTDEIQSAELLGMILRKIYSGEAKLNGKMLQNKS